MPGRFVPVVLEEGSAQSGEEGRSVFVCVPSGPTEAVRGVLTFPLRVFNISSTKTGNKRSVSLFSSSSSPSFLSVTGGSTSFFSGGQSGTAALHLELFNPSSSARLAAVIQVGEGT